VPAPTEISGCGPKLRPPSVHKLAFDLPLAGVEKLHRRHPGSIVRAICQVNRLTTTALLLKRPLLQQIEVRTAEVATALLYWRPKAGSCSGSC